MSHAETTTTNEITTSPQTIHAILNELPPVGPVQSAITWPALGLYSSSNGVTVYGLRSEMRLGYAFAVFPHAKVGEGSLLTITAPRLHINSRNTGRKNGMGAVFFLNTGPNGTVLSESGVLISTNLSERLGQSVANVGDRNGDGFVELVVGAPDHIDSTLIGGIWQMFKGPGPWSSTNSDNPPLVSRSAYHGARKGFCVASAGDANGDGVSGGKLFQSGVPQTRPAGMAHAQGLPVHELGGEWLGGSFHVRQGQRECIFRLYFVDAPKKDEKLKDRVREQCEYFGVTIAERLLSGETQPETETESLPV